MLQKWPSTSEIDPIDSLKICKKMSSLSFLTKFWVSGYEVGARTPPIKKIGNLTQAQRPWRDTAVCIECTQTKNIGIFLNYGLSVIPQKEKCCHELNPFHQKMLS